MNSFVDKTGVPVEPPRVHDPRRPSALASRQHRSPQALPLQSDPPQPAPQTPRGINNNVNALFPPNNQPEERKAMVDLTHPSPLTSPKFEARLRHAAPELVEPWREVNKGKDALIEGLYEQLTKAREEKRKLMQGRSVAWERSGRLPPEVVQVQVQGQQQGWGEGGEGWNGERHDDGVLGREKAEPASPMWRDPANVAAELADEQRRERIRGLMGPGVGYAWQMHDSSHDGSNDSSGNVFGSGGQGMEFSYTPVQQQQNRDMNEMKKPQHTKPQTAKSLKGDLQVLEVQVKTRLMPAIILLSNLQLQFPSGNTTKPPTTSSSTFPAANLKTIKFAQKSVQSAYSLVRAQTGGKTPAAKALMGLCEFYMGVCRMAEGALVGRERNAGGWFEMARVNGGGWYPEGEWAGEWLEASRRVMGTGGNGGSRPGTSGRGSARPGTAGSMRSGTIDQEPGGAGTWVEIWEKARELTGRHGGEGGKPPPLGILHDENQRSPRDDRPSASQHSATITSRGPRRPQLNGLPSFSSMGSGSGAEEDEESPLQPQRTPLRVTNPHPTSSSGSGGVTIPRAANVAPTSPVNSPTY